MSELEVLKQVCNSLEQAKIPYMLTGSLAANFYAVPRMTRDIDIIVEILHSDVDKLFRIFQEDFYVDRDSIDDALKYHGMFNIIHNASVIKVDFIIRKNSSYRELEFKRKRKVHYNNIDVWIVSPEDLILSKLYWAKDSLSNMQIGDVRNLLRSLKNLDHEYLLKWVSELKLEQVYERIKMDA